MNYPNKHPAKWTEEEAYEAAFLRCVECAGYGNNGAIQCGISMPHAYGLPEYQHLRKSWIRGWQDARS